MDSSHLKSGELYFTSFRVEYLHKLFGKFLHGRCVYSSPFIYLQQYGLVNTYFIIWIIMQYYITYFIAQIVPALTFGSSFSWLLDPFDIVSLFIYYFFLALSYFPSLQDTLGSSCKIPVPIPVLEQIILPRVCGSFYWRMVFESKIWVLRYVHCYWSIIASRPSQLTKQGDICVYMNTCTHNNPSPLHTYFYM